MDRNRAVVKTSWINIAANLFLSALKLTVGSLANSVSIITDAVNNISDALSSAITLIGTRLSEKAPDRRHPFGYGRVEYLVSLVIGIIILYAGIETLKSSVERIITPESNEYTAVTLIVIAAAVIIKVFLGLYTKRRGEELYSSPLKVSGKESLHDAIESAAALAAAVIYLTLGISIEAWIGAVLSLLIIKMGLDLLKETAGFILGKSADGKLASAVRRSISSFPEVEDVYGIVIHSYGWGHLMGSAHVEVSDRFKVAWIDNLQRAITRKVREDTGVEMLGLSVYAVNTHSEETVRIRETVRDIVAGTDGAVGMHGFYIDLADKTMSFDVVLEFGVKDEETLRCDILRRVKEVCPEYDISVTLSHEFTDSRL